jgi:ribonuclease D
MFLEEDAAFCHNSVVPNNLLTKSAAMPEFEFVDLSADHNLCEYLDRQECIGVDTEFVREKTFFSRLCLIQFTGGDEVFCADPLGLRQADEARSAGFWRALMRPAWVLHSGRQDVEVIYQTALRMPEHIFDTQIAAALLGYQPQIGYANLVTELFDVELAKSHTRADWSRRPLPQAFVEYAAEDVHYLLPARDILTARLDKLGRLSWAQEDSAELLNASLYVTEPATAIDRVRGAGKLRGAARSAAADLASWREKEALRSNRPRQWIMRDTVLLELACCGAQDRNDLAAIDGLANRTIERTGDELLKILRAGAARKNTYEPPPRPDERQKKAMREMQRRVSACADELGIANEIIAPRKELAAALTGARDSRVFRGWRRDLVGEKLLALLED